ncbi:MAG: deoxyhypusine synthase family protein [Candidatus Micrarchaeota archaeon]
MEENAGKDRKTIGANKLGTGFSHNLKPLAPIDLGKVVSVNDLVVQMKSSSFGARSVGEAADVLEAMVKDEECYKVLTLSGAMTIAKMGLVVCDMVDRGMVDAIVSTGALMAHGFVESVGKLHFKHEWNMDDTKLYFSGYDRVYDTLELERNLDDISEIIQKVLDTCSRVKPLSTWVLHREIGKYLKENVEGRGILKSAYEKNIPVYVPAFTDSELGLDVALYNIKQAAVGKPEIHFDPFADLNHYAENVRNSKKLGIFTIGGGVPRNWAQQVGPYLDLIRYRVIDKGNPTNYLDTGSNMFKRFHYAVRVCPEPVHWGGLSGCTYSEGVSWGKFVPREEGGMWAEVIEDATIAWPLIVKAVMERMDKK